MQDNAFEETPTHADDTEQQRMTNEGGIDPQNDNLVAMSEVLSQLDLTLEAKIEAIVFAADKPLKSSEVVEILEGTITLKEAEKALESLVDCYTARRGGFTLEYIKGQGYQFRTVANAAPLMTNMFSKRPRPISRAALETLAVIAYRQPVTRAEIEFIRGVDAGSIVKNLLERGLISCIGRKQDAGRPMLFGTTDEFLKIFRLPSLSALPSLQSFQISNDLITKAEEKIQTGMQAVNVEEFIGDETWQEGELSDGLSPENTAKETSDLVINEEASAAGPDERAILGASKADEFDGYEQERTIENDANPEVDIADGNNITSASGDLDSTKTNKDQ